MTSGSRPRGLFLLGQTFIESGENPAKVSRLKRGLFLLGRAVGVIPESNDRPRRRWEIIARRMLDILPNERLISVPQKTLAEMLWEVLNRKGDYPPNPRRIQDWLSEQATGNSKSEAMRKRRGTYRRRIVAALAGFPEAKLRRRRKPPKRKGKSR